MSTAPRTLATALLIALGLVTATAAIAHQPRTTAARPLAQRPHPGTSINSGEAARIRFQVHQHPHLQRRANADGTVSRHEQAALARDAAQVRHLIQTARTN
jgi:hypothetical protein